MNAETLRILFAYTIALVLICGGMVFLYFAMDKPSATQTGLLVVVGGFVGAAIQFVFGGAAASQSAKTFEKGVNTMPTGGTSPGDD